MDNQHQLGRCQYGGEARRTHCGAMPEEAARPFLWMRANALVSQVPPKTWAEIESEFAAHVREAVDTFGGEATLRVLIDRFLMHAASLRSAT
jgi:hypothetical protein